MRARCRTCSSRSSRRPRTFSASRGEAGDSNALLRASKYTTLFSFVSREHVSARRVSRSGELEEEEEEEEKEEEEW